MERAVRPARLGVTARLRRALGPSGCPPPRALVGERCAGAATRPDVGVAGRRLVFGVANDIAKDGARSSARGYRSRLARRIPLPLAMRRWTVWLVRAGPGQCQSSRRSSDRGEIWPLKASYWWRATTARGVGVMDAATQRAVAAEQAMIAEADKLRAAMAQFEAQKAEWETQKAAESLKLKQIGEGLKKEWDLLAKAKAKLQAEAPDQ